MKIFDQRESTKEKKESFAFSDAECKRAAEKAMALLSYKDRTRNEMLDRLYRAGFSEKASGEAMAYIDQFGYINDRRYVENYIMFQKGKKSKKEIAYKLSEKGIDKELVWQVLEESEYEGEEEAVRNLIIKRLKGRAVPELTYEEKNKIKAYLGRKGYEFSVIKKVFSQLDN